MSKREYNKRKGEKKITTGTSHLAKSRNNAEQNILRHKLKGLDEQRRRSLQAIKDEEKALIQELKSQRRNSHHSNDESSYKSSNSSDDQLLSSNSSSRRSSYNNTCSQNEANKPTNTNSSRQRHSIDENRNESDRRKHLWKHPNSIGQSATKRIYGLCLSLSSHSTEDRILHNDDSTVNTRSITDVLRDIRLNKKSRLTSTHITPVIPKSPRLLKRETIDETRDLNFVDSNNVPYSSIDSKRETGLSSKHALNPQARFKDENHKITKGISPNKNLLEMCEEADNAGMEQFSTKTGTKLEDRRKKLSALTGLAGVSSRTPFEDINNELYTIAPQGELSKVCRRREEVTHCIPPLKLLDAADKVSTLNLEERLKTPTNIKQNPISNPRANDFSPHGNIQKLIRVVNSNRFISKIQAPTINILGNKNNQQIASSDRLKDIKPSRIEKSNQSHDGSKTTCFGRNRIILAPLSTTSKIPNTSIRPAFESPVIGALSKKTKNGDLEPLNQKVEVDEGNNETNGIIMNFVNKLSTLSSKSCRPVSSWAPRRRSVVFGGHTNLTAGERLNDTQAQWEELGAYIGQVRKQHRLQQKGDHDSSHDASGDSLPQPNQGSNKAKKFSSLVEQRLLPRRHSESNLLLVTRAASNQTTGVGPSQYNTPASRRMSYIPTDHHHHNAMPSSSRRNSSVKKLVAIHKALQTSALSIEDLESETF